MKLIRAFSILILFMACPGLFAGGSGVRLRDLQPKDDDLLRKNLPALFAEEVDLSLLDEAIRLLIARGTYENVFVERRTDGNYDLIGKPVRTVEAVEFTGMAKIDEAELRELLDFKPGERFDRKRAVASGEKMKTYYGEHGFFNTIIEVNFVKQASQNIKIVYSIQEKEPCVIVGLEFLTSNTDLKARLDARFRKLKQRTLTTDRAHRLMNDLNEFLVEQRYLASEISGPEAVYNDKKTKAWLKYEIREPYRWEFYMQGYRALTLTDLYRSLDLRNRERKNVDPASEGAERIRRTYLEKGYPNILVETKVINPAGTYLRRVQYGITEGPRARIRGIEVQGRMSRPSRYYEDYVLKNSSTLVSRGYFNRQDLEVGFRNLITDLRNQGFLRARVLSSRVEFNEKRDRITVFLLLEEGPQTQIRALEFDGNKFFSSFELAQVSGLETNSALHLNEFEESLEKIRNFYYDQGFLEMKLLNEKDDIITYNEKGTQARVVYRIYEGPRIRVHSIAVEGNTITTSGVILKEADFQIGEVLTPAKIEDATARLNKLGLFSRVDIHTVEEGTNVAERTLVITVSDRDPGVFRMGAGVTNERNFTVRGFSGLSYSNLAGTGRGVSLRGEIRENIAQINYPEHEIVAGYLEPFLFNTRTRGRIFLTRSERVFDYRVLERDGVNHKLTQLTTSNRVDLLAERDITLHSKLTWKLWSLESNTDWERKGRCVVDPNNPSETSPDHWSPTWGKCPADTLQIATVGPTFDIDYRDSAFLPTRGSFTRFVVDYSNPAFGSSKDVEFVRTEANFSHYFRMPWKSWVWANSLRGGYVSNLSPVKESGVPASYAFLLGGIYTVRGFDTASYNERIPKQDDDGFNVTKPNQRIIKHDSDYFLVKTEMRFPIYGEHGGVIFYDGGRVDVSGYHFKRPYRDAVGFGYRYSTPVGPLAMDFAFKIRPEEHESPFRFHLSIGTF